MDCWSPREGAGVFILRGREEALLPEPEGRREVASRRSSGPRAAVDQFLSGARARGPRRFHRELPEDPRREGHAPRKENPPAPGSGRRTNAAKSPQTTAGRGYVASLRVLLRTCR